ncbi:hypothetical protein DBIPINDM_006816 [Mesorhizobium sp. AR02]|uniref:hypothetical protein n=1 Tax=Mesorhizobium sp. AR02 TaxID=2865837 RepID=UPI00215FA601|nr:hypothetical protein [Mesorhizobium sp. AR02]UVK53333.1 hypothetical protein DBIPINDM_006816 [Mesorhizobium sp. AR02]
MNQSAVEKAKGRLRVAQKALAALRSSRTFDDFSDSWYVVLTSSKNVYTVLEQGAKGSPQSMQWLGSKKQVRKSDPLLQYMFEARNDDEHGLGSAVHLEPERHDIGISGEGDSNSIRLDGGPFRDVVMTNFATAIGFVGGPPPADLRVTSLDGKPVKVRRTPSTTVLVPISARGDRTYNPPTHHLGVPLQSTSPVAVAELNVTYLEGLVAEAEKLA